MMAGAETTVLIVDDEVDIRSAIAEVLEDDGFRVSLARNGEEALGLLREGLRPAVILLDLMMPVMDGWEFLATYNADDTLARAPVVVMSGSRVNDAPALAQEVLLKPIRLDALLSAVRARCGREGDGRRGDAAARGTTA